MNLLQILNAEAEKKPVTEARAKEVGDALDAYMDQNKIYNLEGSRGVRNFTKIVSVIGYRDLDYFLEDNPGCLEAMVEWIKSQRNDEWFEALGGHDEDEDEDR